MPTSPGARFRSALRQERPLQIAGVINAYAALLAEAAGFRALYLSGAGVSNASHGVPDLGLTTLSDVLEDVRRVTEASDLPLLVDADTGWGLPGKAAREISRAGAAGLHLEDQVELKRCGHRPGKRLVSPAIMAGRVRAAVDGRRDRRFVIMARTDARAMEGLAAAIDRANAYVEAGADMIFAEALRNLGEFRQFCSQVQAPVLANMTEFGKTPLFNTAKLRRAGVRMALYPLSAFRAMSAAALRVYRTIRREGSQRRVVRLMQTRNELYRFLDYERHERRVNRQLARRKK
jgi:methylisocitrate lyase